MSSRRPPSPLQERAFLKSVVYAALFDYPLTLPQLRESLLAAVADEAAIAKWYDDSPLLQMAVEYADGYFFPRGRRDLLSLRSLREDRSRELLRGFETALTCISRMPFVRMVALSGSLAHLNGDEDADLDLFVVTAPRRVWTVTVAVLLLARVFGWRKRLCLNYVVSERALCVAPADLFSANQIIHLRPVIGEEMYLRFLEANRFVERFYPNFAPRPLREHAPIGRLSNGILRAGEALSNWTIAPAFEFVCRVVYGRHLRRRSHRWKSHDQVRLDHECLKLHTSSHRREVMDRFERGIEEALMRAAVATCEESRPLTLGR